MTLLLIDGNSIMNRAYYGLGMLKSKSGVPTNAVYGFLNILLRLKDSYGPDGICVAFDVHKPTFRHKMYKDYKAGRHQTPEELISQFPLIKEVLGLMGIRCAELEGYEADDILGTLSVSDCDMCYIATGDRDSLQLISPKCHVILASTKSGQSVTTEYDETELLKEYGMTPPEMIELKGLQGDSSDNIPGVAGVGPKTATALIQKFHTIDAVYENLDDAGLTPKMREKMLLGKESAFFSRTLGTICKTVPIDTSAESYRITDGDPQKLAYLLSSLDMYKILDKLSLDLQKVEKTAEPEKSFEFSDEKIPGDCEEIYISQDYAFASADGKIYELSADVFETLIQSDVKKNVFDAKSVFAYAKTSGFSAAKIDFCTCLSAYILDPNEKNYDCASLCSKYEIETPAVINRDDEAVKSFASQVLLSEKLKKLLAEREQTELLTKIEIPLAEVLADMENIGFAVDRDGIESFGSRLDGDINSLRESIYSAAGREFNINSPKQLGQVLFEELGLPARKKTKSGYSTNADVLEDLADDFPIVADVLEYRTLTKLKSTYCDGLLDKIDLDGRIRSSFNQTETRTGRISSSEPNLQNIPVRREIGREMRKFFTSRDGCVLTDADYSQIELRVLADIADDKNMIEAFNTGTDIHAVTASQVFDMPLDFVTPQMRSRAKAVNFGIVYGIGAFSLAKDIKVSRKEAQHYIDGYLSHYGGVAEYMERVISDAKIQGYVTTLFGRRRYLPELASSNALQRAFGERVARNAPVQGTAADIIKIAMINVYERLKAEKLKAKLILQVHDELIIETPEDERETVEKLLREEMENAAHLKVKLTADVHSGKTWYDAKG